MYKMIVMSGLFLFLSTGFVACQNAPNTDHDPGKKEKKKDGKKDKKDKDDHSTSPAADVEVLQRWEMPPVLNEISDITNIDNNRFACVQDEAGTIYIYSLQENKITKEIPFSGKGDYEGVTLAGNAAYVVNSSGVIYEVNDITAAKPSVKEYKTLLTGKDDVEALCFDKQNNRLLLAFKAAEAGNRKGIYAFDLKSKTFAKEPVYSIALGGGTGNEKKGKKNKEGIRPSAIAIHPVNGDLYLLEGTNPKLLISDKDGSVKSLLSLNNKDFEQPEGITFNAAGELFISNEGRNGKGNILKVKL